MDWFLFCLAMIFYIGGPIAAVAMLGSLASWALGVRATWRDRVILFLYSIPVVIGGLVLALKIMGDSWGKPPTALSTFVGGFGLPIASVVVGILYFGLGPAVRRHGVWRSCDWCVRTAWGLPHQILTSILRQASRYWKLYTFTHQGPDLEERP